MSVSTAPVRLYKYRTFNVDTLKMFTEAKVYYADPKTFNDPLDCQPDIDVDTNLETLAELVQKMDIRDSNLGMTLGLTSQLQLERSLAGDLSIDSEANGKYKSLLIRYIYKFLDRKFGGFGVYSLAEKFDCPLMWSHYADQHRGLCIGYDLIDREEESFANLGPVNYEGSSSIKTSELMSLISESYPEEIEELIKNRYFFSKAPQWYYEHEWRDVMNDGIGRRDRPARISEVYFGLRCDNSIILTIVKLYAKIETAPKFYRVFRKTNGFALDAKLMDQDELEELSLRRPAIIDIRAGFNAAK